MSTNKKQSRNGRNDAGERGNYRNFDNHLTDGQKADGHSSTGYREATYAEADRFKNPQRYEEYYDDEPRQFKHDGDVMESDYYDIGLDTNFDRDSERREIARRNRSGRRVDSAIDFSGPHRGKGPKGYKRSDEKIQDDVCDRLEQSGKVDASEITVTCQDAVITLSGEVDERQSKKAAESLAESAYGVDDVMNNLTVKKGLLGKLKTALVGDES